MALRVRVCALSQVPEGELAGFAVDGVAVPIMVTRAGGEILAASSMCPHEEVSLLDGRLEGSTVTCPGHAYELDLRTGACAHDRALRLTCYRVTVVGEDVFVDLL